MNYLYPLPIAIMAALIFSISILKNRGKIKFTVG